MLDPQKGTIADYVFQYQGGFSLHVRDFSIKKAKITFVDGISGAGKTTFFDLLTGISPSPLENIIKCQFGIIDYIPTSSKLLPWLNIKENLLVESKLRDVSPNLDLFIFYCNKFGLVNVLCYLPHELSLGMKQRVEIAKALSFKPDLLIMDETMSGIDITSKLEIFHTLQNYVRNNDSAILTTSHNPIDLLYSADIIIPISNFTISSKIEIDFPIIDRLKLPSKNLFSTLGLSEVLTYLATK